MPPRAALLAALAAACVMAATATPAQLLSRPTPRPPPHPPPFFFGTATAAYQVEGAVFEGGRGPSIWDAFSHTPGRTARGDTGDEADDFYHRFRADLLSAAALGASAFRLSLAWPRLLPNGTGGGGAGGPLPSLNRQGAAFYHALLDACEAAGLEPWVTLYHWDLPLALQSSYGGWASPRIVPDFAAYAGAAFAEFGGRVRTWVSWGGSERERETGERGAGGCERRARARARPSPGPP